MQRLKSERENQILNIPKHGFLKKKFICKIECNIYGHDEMVLKKRIYSKLNNS